MWQKFGLAVELAKELAFLRRQVNGYIMVHSTEIGVLWHTDMSMEQGCEKAFFGHLGTQKPKNFPSSPKHGGTSGRHYMKQTIPQS